MTHHQIKTVCVVGSGYMGSQIGLHCAVYGHAVWMCDANAEALERGAAGQAKWLDEQIEAGAVAADQRQTILDRIRRSVGLAESAAGADIVIEAITENLAVKRNVFHELDQLCPPRTILTTNSSSIRISRIESATGRPHRVLNTHFVQPVWKHPFVELMRGTETSDDTLESVRRFMASMGVIPFLVRRENTGFIFNRIWRAVKKESLRLVDQGVATFEDVDRSWMIQMETSMGPFAMMDHIGLDVVRDIEQVYYEESGDPSDAPPQVLLDKIAGGELGVKAGKGFYTYPDADWQSIDFLKKASPM